jgi:hypothetical protein
MTTALFAMMLLAVTATQTIADSNLLNCMNSTSVERVADNTRSFQNVIIHMVHADNHLFYILQEQDEQQKRTYSLNKFNPSTKQHSTIDRYTREMEVMNGISNIVNNQYHVSKLMQDDDFVAKLQIMTVQNDVVVNTFNFEDNSTSPKYDKNGTIIGNFSTNDTFVFSSIYRPIPIVQGDTYTTLLVNHLLGPLVFVKRSGNQQTSTVIIPAVNGYSDMYSTGRMQVNAKTGEVYILASLYYDYVHAFANFHGVNASLFTFKESSSYKSINVLIKLNVDGQVLGIQQIGLPHDLLVTYSLFDMIIEWNDNGTNNLHTIGRAHHSDQTDTALYMRQSDIDKSAYQPQRTPNVYQLYKSIANPGKSSSAYSILLDRGVIFIAGDTNYYQVSTGSVTEPGSSILFRINYNTGEVEDSYIETIVQGRSDRALFPYKIGDRLYYALRYDGPITHSTDFHIKSGINEVKCSSKKPTPEDNPHDYRAAIIAGCVGGGLIVLGILVGVLLLVRHHFKKNGFQELK